MKERPIIFSAPMVCAILEGRKTQTRRIIPEQPKIDPQTGDWLLFSGKDFEQVFPIERFIESRKRLSKYGSPGDRLWVRETWARQLDGNYIYRADYPIGYNADYTAIGNWKPSIHMPRTASRILLEITDVRVEMLDDISEADAVSEGVYFSDRISGFITDEDGRNFHGSDPRISFIKLWQSINGPDSWNQNPFVWVIEFKPSQPS